jgi:integrase
MGDIVRRPSGWYVRYKDVDGRRKQRASHQPTKELARRYLLEIEGRIARGLLGVPEAPPIAPTVDELAARFVTEYRRPRIKDPARYRAFARTALRRASPLIGARPADTLRPADLLAVRDTLGRRYSANSVRLTLSFLATAYGWAVKAMLLSHNPLRGVELPPRQTLIEYLSRQEVRALLAAAEVRARTGDRRSQLLHACVLLALHSGLRKGELLGLRWCDVDLDAHRLTVARSFRVTPKGGRVRHLRLHEAMVPVLAAWRPQCPRTPEDLVFPVIDEGPARMGTSTTMLGLPELLAAAGCRPLRRAWHALRHTFASHYVMAGGNLLALQRMLGHSDIQMTMAYAHLAPDFLADELNKLRF